MERIGFIPILFHLYARRGFELGHDFVVNQVRMRVKAIGELAHQGRDDAHSHRECILQNCKAILGRGSILVHFCRGASLHWFLRQVLYLSFCFTCLGEDSPCSRLRLESGSDVRLRRCLLASTSRAETHFPKENASCRGASLHWFFLPHHIGVVFVLLAPSWIRSWSRLCRESGSQVRRKPLSAVGVPQSEV